MDTRTQHPLGFQAHASTLLWMLAAVCSLLLLQGCLIRTEVVHDGIQSQVIDAVSRKPLDQAFAYTDVSEDRQPQILALSNEQGELNLEPKRRLTITQFLGESISLSHLWVCRPGYEPVVVGLRHGWNVQFGRSTIYRPASIALSPASGPDAKMSCSYPPPSCHVFGKMKGCSPFP